MWRSRCAPLIVILAGHLLANLELGHHPLAGNKTYQDLISNAELDRVGRKRWRRRVDLVIETINRIFNPDLLHIGGGNAEKLRGPFPDHVHLFDNIEGMVGGVRLWDDMDRQVERVADTVGT